MRVRPPTTKAARGLGHPERQSRFAIAAIVAALAVSPAASVGGAAAGARDDAARAIRGSAAPAIDVRLEYERRLRQVVVSVPVEYLGQAVRGDAAWTGSAASSAFLHHVYREFLAALPSYTVIHATVRPVDRTRAIQMLYPLAAGRPLRLHVVDAAEMDLWAQDLGEPILVDGEERFLVSMPIDASMDLNRRMAADRARIVGAAFGDDKVMTADFAFEGGNLAFDRTEDGLRVFVGYNDVTLTVDNYEAQGRRLTRREAVEKMAAGFGGAEVIVVGTEPQSRFLPHIDQAFIVLADRVAVVNQIAGKRSKEQRLLQDYKAQLEALGYRTIVIENTQQEIEHYRTSTNAVPFVDAQTGERRIIFPVFPDEVDPAAGERLGESDLRGKGLRAYEAYEAAGYRPTPVRDFAHVAGGNTHCISNVLY